MRLDSASFAFKTELSFYRVSWKDGGKKVVVERFRRKRTGDVIPETLVSREYDNMKGNGARWWHPGQRKAREIVEQFEDQVSRGK